jgi:hypothetical protein
VEQFLAVLLRRQSMLRTRNKVRNWLPFSRTVSMPEPDSLSEK